MTGITLEITGNTMGMLRLTSWKEDFFLFSGCLFVSNIAEGEWIFAKFSEYVEHDSRNNLPDRFTYD